MRSFPALAVLLATVLAAPVALALEADETPRIGPGGDRLLLQRVQTGRPRTIVGVWRLVGRQCTPFEGAIQIKPLAIKEHEAGCDFKSVSRTGDVVRWVGLCSSELDSDEGRASAMRTIVVTARAYGDMLTLQYGDGPESQPYVRCNRTRLFD